MLHAAASVSPKCVSSFAHNSVLPSCPLLFFFFFPIYFILSLSKIWKFFYLNTLNTMKTLNVIWWVFLDCKIEKNLTNDRSYWIGYGKDWKKSLSFWGTSKRWNNTGACPQNRQGTLLSCFCCVLLPSHSCLCVVKRWRIP